MKDNWINKTLDELEDIRSTKDYDSFLVSRVITLRKTQIKSFSVEDLRLMIGQNEGLSYLLPAAIEVLNKELFVEGDYYEGDLLQSVLSIDHDTGRLISEVGN